MTGFKKGDIVAWHGAGPYVYDHQVTSPVTWSSITAPDGSTHRAGGLNLTPYQPTEYEDTGLVECGTWLFSHTEVHRLVGSCIDPQPIYRRVHVCGPFEERFVAGQFQTCEFHGIATPERHRDDFRECANLRTLGTMESVCTVCGVAK